jgi:hypothetical protein
VRRYREDDVFADTVQRVASGLGLVVLAVGPASGLVLAAVEDSAFEIRMDEYARRTVLANRHADKVMHGLAHLAVAALAFPRADDLADDTYVGRVSVDQVDGAVREAGRALSERVAGTAEADPVSDARSWRRCAGHATAAACRGAHGVRRGARLDDRPLRRRRAQRVPADHPATQRRGPAGGPQVPSVDARIATALDALPEPDGASRIDATRLFRRPAAAS